jgi:c-di-GMP-related signal transduction protein
MEVYVARQPIFKKNKHIFGYELLFRGGMSNYFPEIDQDIATSSLLSNSFVNMGIESITGRKTAFINFTEKLLLQKLPMLFPKEKLVVEILEDVEPTPDVIDVCKDIHRKGYHIALDDFFYHAKFDPLIELAGTIKLDFRAMSLEAIAESVEILSKYNVKFLAEKVETYDEFNQAVEMGFEYFQGFFFSKPEILRGVDISSTRMSLLEIMAEANKNDFKFHRLEDMISRDVIVSYKLLRYINSAYYRRLNEISSIHQALVMLGEKRIRRFMSLLAMTNLASDKPHELIRTSIIRAKFCETVGEMSPLNVSPDELFTLGLFSLIDAILDDSMENLMAKLPLSEAIKGALISEQGPLCDYLSLSKHYEMGAWGRVSEMAESLGLKEKTLPQGYLAAVGYGDFFISM